MIVIKRDGSQERFNQSKVRNWIQYASANLAEQVEIEHYVMSELLRRLPEKVTTEEIHQTMIQVLLDKEEIIYANTAAILERASIYKNLEAAGFLKPQYSNFIDLLDFLVEKNVWRGAWLDQITYEDEDTLNELFIELESIPSAYPTIKQWQDKYSKKIKDLPVETVAMGAIAISVALHGCTQLAYDVARDIVSCKLNLPTPALNGLRDGTTDSVSCCVIEAKDTVDSIQTAIMLAGSYTSKKSGIGINLDTRSKGDSVKNNSTEHLGKAPLFKAVEASVKQFTQLTRGGSSTISIKCIDPDIQSQLLWKTQRIDLAQRIDKVDYSFLYNDAFVHAVLRNEDWHLFSIVDAPEVHANFHTKNYESFVRKALANGVKHKKVKALDLLIEFLKSRAETGRVYCLNVTRVNEHTPFNDVITQSNLCVAPETKILTDVGYIEIASLENEEVNVWNGVEFSKVTVRKTGKNQKLVKVITDSGYVLECTPEHKFYEAVGYSGEIRELRAKDLKRGTKLIKLDTPLITGTKELEHPYENGFYSADGCFVTKGSKKRLYFYQDKRDLVLPFMDEALLSEGAWYEQEEHKRIYIDLPSTCLKEKFFVPDNNFTVESRLKWLAGYMDGDGCIYKNGDNHQMVATSVDLGFLQDIQLMLQTLGVQAKITTHSAGGKQLLPKNDGSGELGLYDCKTSWRLIITSNGLYKLGLLGLQTNRLEWTLRKPQRDAAHFIKVHSVKDLGRVDDTYCFTEPKKHMGVFNGLLTGQCMEINLPTAGFDSLQDMFNPEASGEVAFCSLAAINVSAVSREEYAEVAERALRTVDRMLELAPGLYPHMEHSMKSRRSIGIGITGLASYLYEQGLDYDGSYRSLVATEQLGALHYYSLLSASQKMSRETGFEVSGVNLDWLPLDTAKYVTNLDDWDYELDWEALRGLPRLHSVLVAHMPTESSAVFSNSTNGLYPSREKVVYKKARTGKVAFISEYYNNSKIRCWDTENTMHLYYAAIQNSTDQGISPDYYLDYTKYPGMKVPVTVLIKWFIDQWAAGNKSAYYLVFKDTKVGEVDCTSCKL